MKTAIVKVPAYKLIVGNADIAKAIASIKTAGAKLDKNIQVAALSVLAHIEQHGDITLFESLYAAMPKGARKLALCEWAFKFGKLSANTDEKSKAVKPFLFDKAKTTNMEQAMIEPWFDFKPEAKPDQAFDFQAMLLALITKAEKRGADGKEVINSELMLKAKALLG